ncbi:hypothetical protein DB29_01376 [Shouchella clausii]|nr:hypothetical protein DB29_01376 [Shouchella clausii]
MRNEPFCSSSPHLPPIPSYSHLKAQTILAILPAYPLYLSLSHCTQRKRNWLQTA